MDIHKPKPVHSWRELLKEIGIIVIGVAIALAGEQAVEALRNHHRAEQAREGIRGEIALGLGHIATRDRLEACVSHRLEEVDGLIAALAAGKLPPGPIWIGRPYFYILPDSQFKTAIQSGAAGLLSNQEQAAYGSVYNAFSDFTQAELVEQMAWSDLRVLEKHPAPSPALDALLRSAIQRVRTARWGNAGRLRSVAKPGAAALGIKPVKTFNFTMQSICIPLGTPRDKAEDIIENSRTPKVKYDEP